MVLILFSRQALANGIVFLACIMVPVFLIPFIGATGQDAAATTTSERSATQGIVLLIVAAVLLLIAWLNFRARHSHSAPKIFGKIQGMGPWAVVFLSAGVTIANPKNLVVLLPDLRAQPVPPGRLRPPDAVVQGSALAGAQQDRHRAKQRHGSSEADHSDVIRSRARDPNRPGHPRAASRRDARERDNGSRGRRLCAAPGHVANEPGRSMESVPAARLAPGGPKAKPGRWSRASGAADAALIPYTAGFGSGSVPVRAGSGPSGCHL